MSRREGAEQPQRSCLACRSAKDKERLIRFVLSPAGEVVPDLDGKLPGRGAYTCLSSACVTAAVKNRQFSRSFKCEAAAGTPEAMGALVDRLLRERISGCLGLANKAGKIISGSSLVIDALRSPQKPGYIILATDISEAIGERIRILTGVHNVPCAQVLSKDDFGDLLGKAPRSAVAVRPGGFAQQLKRLIERYSNFLGEVGQI